MSLYYITNSNWLHFLNTIVRQYRTYAVVKNPLNELVWKKLNIGEENTPVLDSYRALTSSKQFFFPVKEEVTSEPEEKKTVILGLKACDLHHIKILDSIFSGGEISDPYFELKRKNTLIFSSDCCSFAKTCFCTSMGGSPFATQGFDMNLTALRGGFIVQTGSAVCENMVLDRKRLFQEPQSFHLKEREEIRKKIKSEVEENNRAFTWDNPKEIVEKNYDSKKWENEVAPACVECDACRFVCGSCYCFLLSETGKNLQKLRNWDSCQSAGYSRVAGGGNPRKARYERLRNFYGCKMVYRMINFNLYGCSGCGRCISVCQGKIDIRKSIQKISEKA